MTARSARDTTGAIRSAVMVFEGPERVSLPVARARLGDVEATSNNDNNAARFDLRIFTSQDRSLVRSGMDRT